MQTNTPPLRSITLFALLFVLGGCAALAPKIDPPHVSLSDLKLKDVGLFEQRFTLTLRIQNPNDFALPIKGMDYEVFLNDQKFARGVSNDAVTVPALGEALASVDVVSNAGSLWQQAQTLMNGKQTALRYRLSGGLRVVNRAVKIPFDYQGEFKLNLSEQIRSTQ